MSLGSRLFVRCYFRSGENIPFIGMGGAVDLSSYCSSTALAKLAQNLAI